MPGAEFCYVCGVLYTDYGDKACDCPIYDEDPRQNDLLDEIFARRLNGQFWDPDAPPRRPINALDALRQALHPDLPPLRVHVEEQRRNDRRVQRGHEAFERLFGAHLADVHRGIDAQWGDADVFGHAREMDQGRRRDGAGGGRRGAVDEGRRPGNDDGRRPNNDQGTRPVDDHRRRPAADRHNPFAADDWDDDGW